MTILSIETSTNVCSVAVQEEGHNIFVKEDVAGPNHARILAPFVQEALRFTDNHAIPFDAVAVSIGPGSYTGLRIGLSTAKGVCYARELPLITIPTLELMCAGPLLTTPDDFEDDALLIPLMDARRMEVYAAVYDRALRVVRDDSADIIDENSYQEYLDEKNVYFLGNGMPKCREILGKHPHAHFIDGVYPNAKYMGPLAMKRLLRNDIADLAYCEPHYLKEFQATVARDLLEKVKNNK